jgi:hypothetical protein
MPNYQHIYSTLRSALVDRDRDPSFIVDDCVIVGFGKDQFALRKYVPSGALLVAYSMLFYPGFLDVTERNPYWMLYARVWLGGEQNPKYPLLPNEIMAGIAIAVGVYAGFIKAIGMTEGVAIRPNFDHPMVKKTHELIRENGLELKDAKQTFIELMQQEEYAKDILVADDFIANPFIAEFNVGVNTATTVEELRKASELL